MNSNATSESKPNQPTLKVLAPHLAYSQKPNAPSVPPPPPASTDQAPQLPARQTRVPRNRWFIILTTLGLVGVGMIPIPNFVTGRAEVAPAQQGYQNVTMTYPGLLRVRVQPNQLVTPGTVIAEIENDALQQEIAAAEIALETARAEVSKAEQELSILEQNYQEYQTTAQASEMIASQTQKDIYALSRGTLPTRQVLESEVQSLEVVLANQEADVQRYQRLVDNQVYQPNAKPLIDSIANRDRTRTEISGKQQQILDLEKQIVEKLEQQQMNLQQKYAAVQASGARVRAARIAIQDNQKLVKKRAQQLSILRSQLQKLTIRSTVTGTAIIPDLDSLNHRFISQGEKLFDIVALSQLTAKVQVAQEDFSWIKPDLKATFHPRDTVGQSYVAIVQPQDIGLVAKTENSQQPSDLTIRVLIHNHDNILRPGMQGTTHIHIGKISIYHKLKREFLRLVPIEKWKVI